MSAAIRLPEASQGTVTGAAQVVHFWAIIQQSAVPVKVTRSYTEIPGAKEERQTRKTLPQLVML
jgi:hypothetical protein